MVTASLKRIVVLTIGGGATFVAFFIAGQSVEDIVFIKIRKMEIKLSILFQSEEFNTALSETNWYILDKENKMNFFILLVQSMKHFKLSFSRNYALNFQLALAVRYC